MKIFWCIVFTISALFCCEPSKNRSSPPSFTTMRSIDTIEVCGAEFLKELGGDTTILSVTDLSGRKLFTTADHFVTVKLSDFNLDDCADIVAEVRSREAGDLEIFLFDHATRTFRELKYMHANPVMIKGTNLYYSYERMGCSDLKWQSLLCEIDSFKSKPIASIQADGCNGKNSVTVLRCDIDGKKTTIETIVHAYASDDDKWSYIENYWMNNYATFH